ncbi:hypothetical protein JX266_008450 [Neoarthrinium moseri]|nr:hypothetical protein JX266_008450 [Neoarthrinium moseri]
MDRFAYLLIERGLVQSFVVPLLASIFILYSLRLLRESTNKIPLVGRELGNTDKRRRAFIENAREIYKNGYREFKNRAWRVTGTDGDRIILPRHLIHETRHMPDSHFNLTKAFEKVMVAKYTGIGGNQVHTDFLAHVVRGDLTRSLNRINYRLNEASAKTVLSELGSCEEWTPVVVYQKLLRIVAIISGNIFLGPDLCQSDDWINPAINYTVNVIGSMNKLKEWKPWLRPIGQHFITEIRTFNEQKKKARTWLAPVIAARRQLMEDGEELPDDVLQWMMNKGADFNISDDELSLVQLNLSLAAIHTTTFTTTMILYDLAVRPELVQELRDEIRTVLAANNDIFTTRALFQMKLLDSTMKESQRINPGNLVRFVRYVNQPVTLSDGTHLSPGSMIEAPYGEIAADPELYTNPETFDAHRFVNLRNGLTTDPLLYKNKEQYQFVTTTKDFMHFGYGRHSCPGRFFAANEIKIVLARILLGYDIKMPDGVMERYPNIDVGLDSMPDSTKEIFLRRVKVAA